MPEALISSLGVYDQPVVKVGVGDELPNAVTRDFARRLNEILGSSRANPNSLYDKLQLNYPEVAVSKSLLYRLTHGTAMPRLDLIIALAEILNVSPRDLVPDRVPKRSKGAASGRRGNDTEPERKSRA